MIFLSISDKPIDLQMQKLLDEIEAPSHHLSVLAARQFRYSLHQTPVEVTISEPRKFNVLEEFILRAGIEIDPPPTEKELAGVLGLDPVFVQSSAATLRSLQTLEVAQSSRITVTPQGRQFYQQGTVLQPPYSLQIYAVADPLVGQFTFHSEPLDTGLKNQLDLADFVTIENRIPHVSSLEIAELQQLVQASGLGLHVPEAGKIVTSYSVAAPTQTIWKTMSLFVIFDALEEQVQLQVRQGKRILEDASGWLETLLVEGKVSLKALCEVSEEITNLYPEATLNQKNAQVEVRIEKIRQQTPFVAREKGESDQQQVRTENGDVVRLRDRQIRQAFLETLNSACSNILIYSPWVSEKVINDEFIQLLQELANRRVLVLIGYGISGIKEDEEWLVPQEVIAKLKEVRTPEGLPGVQIFRLGNSHAKEVVVDGKVYLCSSYNWLSYQGDWLLRGEDVYQITTPNTVQEAYKDMVGRFQSQAQELWHKAVQNHDLTLAEVSICVWGALSLEDMALNQLQQNNFLELLPVWLKVALHGLRSQNLSPDSASFATALSLQSEISETEPYIDSLREGWHEVMGAIASHNPHTALTLLTNEAWSHFTRLGIAQLPIDSPEKLISEYTAVQKQPTKTSPRKRTTTSNRKPKPKK